MCYNCGVARGLFSIGRVGLVYSFLLATALFTVSVVLGTRVPPALLAEMLEEMGRLLEPVSSLGPFALFLVIFLNNAVKALGVIVLGVVLGLPPLLFVSYNGFAIGALVSGLKSVIGWEVIAAGLIPHGVIEVPLLLLATALGFVVGGESLKWLIRRKSAVRAKMRQGLKLYLKWILAGLFIAAVIEVFVTPFIMLLVGGEGLAMW